MEKWHAYDPMDIPASCRDLYRGWLGISPQKFQYYNSVIVRRHSKNFTGLKIFIILIKNINKYFLKIFSPQKCPSSCQNLFEVCSSLSIAMHMFLRLQCTCSLEMLISLPPSKKIRLFMRLRKLCDFVLLTTI